MKLVLLLFLAVSQATFAFKSTVDTLELHTQACDSCGMDFAGTVSVKVKNIRSRMPYKLKGEKSFTTKGLRKSRLLFYSMVDWKL